MSDPSASLGAATAPPTEEPRPARLRDLSSVSAVLNTDIAAVLLDRFGRQAATDAIRGVLDEARQAMRAGAPSAPTAE
jgi:L-seryl-tRNA(Ser) seleniumtransferase